MSSPMDTAISKKKRAIKKATAQVEKFDILVDTHNKNNGTQSTNLSMQNCDDGMSPLQTKFNYKKK